MPRSHALPHRLGAVVLTALALGAACTAETETGAAPPSQTAGATQVETTSVPNNEHPLYLSISIHVEGFRNEIDNLEMFQVHRDAILDVARRATDHGAVLSLEIGAIFVEAAATHDDDVLRQLATSGHSVQVHADLGGAGTLRLADFADELRSQRRALEAATGQPASHVSGICSEGPWVEAASRAGFTSTNGAVAYCMKSLLVENVPAGAEWIAACATPADCHGPMEVTADQRDFPFLIDSSQDFLSDLDAAQNDRGIVLSVSESSWSLDCLDEGFDAPRCAASSADVAIAAAALETSLGNTDPERVALLQWSWSIGTPPDGTFADELFVAFSAAVQQGAAEWMPVANVAQLARQQILASSST